MARTWPPDTADSNRLYSILPSFALGFHGCDESVADAVLAGNQQLFPSRNKYDWLGEGIYFWENSPTMTAPTTAGFEICGPCLRGWSLSSAAYSIASVTA